MPRRWRIAALFALTMAALCPGAEPVTPPESIKTMADLCRITASDGLLKFDSPLETDLYPPVSFPFLSDNGATISARISRYPAAHISHFSLAIRKNEAGAIITDGIELRPTFLTLYHKVDSVDPAHKRRISLTQNFLTANDAFPRDPYSPVVLKVYDRSTEPPTILETLRGQTLEDLIEANPGKADLYLHPILHGLQMESLLSPPALTAMQVFKSDFPPDPAQSAKVAALVAQLDADWPPDRDAASAALASLDDPGKLILLEENRAILSPEQLARIDTARGTIASLTTDQIARLQKDPHFLLRCLLNPDRPIRAAALKALNETTQKSIQFDLDANPDSRAKATARISTGLFPPAPTSPDTPAK